MGGSNGVGNDEVVSGLSVDSLSPVANPRPTLESCILSSEVNLFLGDIRQQCEILSWEALSGRLQHDVGRNSLKLFTCREHARMELSSGVQPLTMKPATGEARETGRNIYTLLTLLA